MMTNNRRYLTKSNDTGYATCRHGPWFFGTINFSARQDSTWGCWNEAGVFMGDNRGFDLIVEPEDKPALWSSAEDVFPYIGAIMRAKDRHNSLHMILSVEGNKIYFNGGCITMNQTEGWEWRWPQETTWRPCVKGGAR